MDSDSSNPISPPLISLLERLTVLNGFVSLLDNQLDSFRESLIYNFTEQKLDLKHMFAGYALIVSDLTVPMEQKYEEWLAAGKFTRTGDEYSEATDELISHWSAWTVVQSYEAFETFLRDLSAYYYLNFKPSKPIGKLEQVPIEVDSLLAWKSYFRSRVWNTHSLLEQVRATAPSLRNYEKSNISRIDLAQWHLLFAAVRHAATHSNLVMSSEQLRTVSKEAVENLLPIAFPGTWHDDVYKLAITKDEATEVIKTTAAYSYLIFKCLCVTSGLDPEVLKRY